MAGNPLTDPNWAEATTDQVVKLVDNVKAKTTKPAVMAARGLVFGLLAVFLGIFALVLLIIGVTRGLQAAIEPLLDQGRAVYISYFIIGGIFTLIGAILFKKRNDTSGAV
jgi:hypothetical protein